MSAANEPLSPALAEIITEVRKLSPAQLLEFVDFLRWADEHARTITDPDAGRRAWEEFRRSNRQEVCDHA